MEDSLIGRFAISKAGHDKSQIYVIIGEENEFVSLCDGRLKTVNKPKKKRRKHVQMMNYAVEEALRQRLYDKDKVLDEEIKYAIKHYNNQEQI